jgi:hypothetical protein
VSEELGCLEGVGEAGGDAVVSGNGPTKAANLVCSLAPTQLSMAH